MRKLLIFMVFLSLFVISCEKQATDFGSGDKFIQPAEDSRVVEMPSPPQPVQENVEIPVEPEVVVQDINKVKIERFKFVPDEMTIKPGTEISWQNDDSKFHMVACYRKDNQDSTRVFRSDRIEQGNTYSYTFDSAGNYYCVEPMFGQRMIVNVKEENKITGKVVLTGSFNPINALLVLAILSIVLVVFVSYKYTK